MNSERKLLSECKTLIEKKTNWGPSEDWKQRDYENLIQLIYNETDTLLSLTTIKRIWKKDFDQTPHPSTLNALAKFAGFENWLDFKNRQGAEVRKKSKGNRLPVMNKRFLSGILLLCFSIIILIIWSDAQSGREGRADLTSRKVISNGVPNTVIFDYQFNNFKDSVFFQQSWNPYERIFVSPDNNQLTAIYYFPGYHEAKLIYEDNIVASTRVHITTDGWLMTVRYDPYDIEPVHVADEGLINSGILYVSPLKLKQNLIDVEKKDYWISYFNVKDFGEVYGSGFELTARVKNSTQEGGLLCQYLHIYVYCENSAMVVPFGDAGCAGNFNVILFDRIIRGRETDLSLLGTDLNYWNDITLKVEENRSLIKLNGMEVLKENFATDPGKIVGLHFMFYGAGSLDEVALSDSAGKLVYFNDFQ